ncbi:MAG TPA: SDR family oxidoreductase [Streptosporangiaceae bacterium]|nr:SDR family oxidoreductase [Streptosporangiaceae bacterium]
MGAQQAGAEAGARTGHGRTVQVALITGGSKGIGYACAERLLADGYAVAICARNAGEVETATHKLGGRGDVLGLRADVGSADDCAGLVPAVMAHFGRIDALVNNAGVYTPVPFLDITADIWDALMAINVRGAVLLGVAAARVMRDQGGGRIVNIASTSGQMSEAKFAHYNASKAAIISLTKSMAVELAPLGILVNAVAPGWVLTPLSEPFVATLGDEALGRISPLRRVGTAAEVAGAVSFLCGPDAGYITGTTVNVDGGLIAMHPAV